MARGVTAKGSGFNLKLNQISSFSLSLSLYTLSLCVSPSLLPLHVQLLLCCLQLKVDCAKHIVLAGLRVFSRLGGGNRRRKVKIKVMEWWRKIVFPVRRAWFAVSARVKARENGAGLLKLHDDIQTCGYEDVQIMWEMLKKTESEVMSSHNSKRKRWFLRNFSWSSHGGAAPALSINGSE